MKKGYTLEEKFTQGKYCLRFYFVGTFTKEAAEKASAEWKSICLTHKNNRYTIIFNAKEMVGYEPLARANFQKTIGELKSQIEAIWVVTDSKIISAGATIMGMFASMPIKSVSEESRIIL